MHSNLKKCVDNVVDTESEDAKSRMANIINAASKDNIRGRYFAYGDIHLWSLCAGVALGVILTTLLRMISV